MASRRPHGQLKLLVLGILRDSDEPLSARDVLRRWPPDETAPAFTTVITVLTRLHAAGAVTRLSVDGEEYRFARATVAPASAADSMLSALTGSADRSGALLTFAGHLNDDDLQVLRRALGADPTDDIG